MADADRRPPTRRLFFALWPDATLRAAAAAHVATLVLADAGRPQRADQLHVTVVFLGAVAESRLAEVHAVAGGLTGAPFTVEFDRLEYWRKPRVLALCASVVPPALEALVERLRGELAARQLPTESRPYVPHLTLARKLARFERASGTVELLRWPAAAITLVESRSLASGSHYEPLASWPLEALR
jgi:RNA 2',3'-cyclic 3'-phosphodiesterase